MAKKSDQRKTPTPEYDSERETRVLLEKISTDVGNIAGQVAYNSTKLDKVGQDVDQLKTDMNIVKTGVQVNSNRIDQNSKKLDKIDKKLDAIAENHEHRIRKLEAVR